MDGAGPAAAACSDRKINDGAQRASLQRDAGSALLLYLMMPAAS
jgi:hypothetical protein